MFVMKRMIAAALACMAIMLPAFAQDFRGYEKGRGYQYVSFGSYPQGEQGEALPIVWRVLHSKDGLLYAMSEYILDVRRIDGDQWNYKGWRSSELYPWLNGEMLQTAFTPQERAALHEDEELGFLSLPSLEDIRNPAYGFSDDRSRQFVGTPYALTRRGLYRYSGRAYSPVWTRTPSQKTHAHRSTKSGGSIGFIGVESDDLGLVPVIWLEEEALSVLSGEGTLALPFVLAVKEEANP